MDSQPPNDPNRNGGPAPNAASSKDAPAGPRRPGLNEDGDMEMINLQDNGMVVVMFLMSVAGWMLRERCVC